MEEERLSDRLRRGEMSLELAVLIARQVADYLSACHDAGRPHGALDPAQIVLTNEQHASVTVSDERPDATTADDVHALGLVLFRMVTGLPPTGASSLMRTWRPDVPTELEALVAVMLAQRDRPSMAEVRQRLHAIPLASPERPEVTQLRKELVRARASNDFAKALDTAKLLIEADHDHQGAWYLAAGELCRDHLEHRDEALEHFDYASDAYWSNEPTDANAAIEMAPFLAIDRLLTEASDWKGLERAHRKMLTRMRSYPKFATLQAELWDRLGDIYRTRLDREEVATAAFEQARTLRGSAG
jgi:tetratricopeptide (TPR) repeat protein